MTPKIIEAAKNVVKIPATYGHGDIGDILVSVLKEEMSEDEALIEIEFMRQDYEGDAQ